MIVATKEVFSVAKYEMLFAWVTLSVAISSPLLNDLLTNFYGWTITSREEVKMKCSDMSDHNAKLARHNKNLVATMSHDRLVFPVLFKLSKSCPL